MQRVEFEKFCKELIELHRERMYSLEMQFLKAKHGLKRSTLLGLGLPVSSIFPNFDYYFFIACFGDWSGFQ